MQVSVKGLSEQDFSIYGFTYEPDPVKTGYLPVKLTEHCTTKIVITDLTVTDRIVSALSYHPNTWECFIPLEGVTLLYVSDKGCSDMFLLDHCVYIKENIGHSLVTLSGKSMLKVAEKKDVILKKEKLKDEIWPL